MLLKRKQRNEFERCRREQVRWCKKSTPPESRFADTERSQVTRISCEGPNWLVRGAKSRVVRMQPQSTDGSAYVLVVDDEYLVRMMVCDCLRETGLKVMEACSGDDALCTLQAGVPVDVILSDVRMPGSIDGLGLLQQSRAAYPDLPVIIMSGHLSADDALSKGAMHFLAKPFSIDAALALVKHALIDSIERADR